MRHTSSRTLTLLALSLLQPVAPSSAREIDRPDLSGHWVLDVDRSPVARGAGPELSRAGRRRGRDSDPGGHPTGAGQGDPRAMREQLAALERAAAELEIRREGEGFALHDGLGRDWPVSADGVEHAALGPEGVETFVRSEWDERGRLKIWRVRVGALTTEQTLELADDGAALLVETRLTDGGRAERTLTRHYSRAPATEATADDRDDAPPAAP